MNLKEEEKKTSHGIIRLLFNGIYLNKFQMLNQMEEEQINVLQWNVEIVNIKLDLRLIKRQRRKKKHILLVMMM